MRELSEEGSCFLSQARRLLLLFSVHTKVCFQVLGCLGSWLGNCRNIGNSPFQWYFKFWSFSPVGLLQPLFRILQQHSHTFFLGSLASGQGRVSWSLGNSWPSPCQRPICLGAFPGRPHFQASCGQHQNCSLLPPPKRGPSCRIPDSSSHRFK